MTGGRVKELILQWRPHASGAVVDRALHTPKDCAALLVPMLEHQPQEVCVVVLLNAKHGVLGVHEVGRGSLTECVVDPGIVFRAALVASAPCIIIAHNHPSGDPSPSQPDIDLTRRLVAAGQLLGVQVLDHVIVGDQGYTSLKDRGIL